MALTITQLGLLLFLASLAIMLYIYRKKIYKFLEEAKEVEKKARNYTKKTGIKTYQAYNANRELKRIIRRTLRPTNIFFIATTIVVAIIAGKVFNEAMTTIKGTPTGEIEYNGVNTTMQTMGDILPAPFKVMGNIFPIIIMIFVVHTMLKVFKRGRII